MNIVFIPRVFTSQNIAHYNYVAGVRFNLKKANYKDNPHDIYEEAVPEVWEENEMTAWKQNAGEDTDNFGDWSYEDENSFNYSGGFTELLINADLAEAEKTWAKLEKDWINDAMVALSIEIIVHNSNLMTTVYYAQIFT